MALKIISADERMAQAHLRGSVFVGGGYKIGKTTLARTLPEETTLFLDFEAGTKSISDWRGDIIEIRDFIDAVDIACLIGGIDISSGPNDMFSKEHYDRCAKLYPELAAKMDKYQYIFFDSISRLSFAAAKYAKQQPESYTLQGKPDKWGMYGLIASSMLTILTHIQHSNKNAIFVGLIEDVEDDFGRHQFKIQLEGAKTGRELPGIVDMIVTMAIFDFSETGEWILNPNGKYRGLVCTKANPWGFPAGNRSPNNAFDLVEEPHLGHLFEKLNQSAKKNA